MAGNDSGAWLRNELAAQLRPVSAPDSLWRSIHEQRRPLRVQPRRGIALRIQPRRGIAWPVAAAALVAVIAGVVWRPAVIRSPGADLEVMAGRELRGLEDGSLKVDLQSADSREIRSWVHAKSNMDVRLPDRATPGNQAIRLIGARMTQVGVHPVAVISYRVGDDLAAMLVTDSGGGTESGELRHGSLQARAAKGISLYSWALGGDEYTIAFGGAQESSAQACLLCHAVPPATLMLK